MKQENSFTDLSFFKNKQTNPTQPENIKNRKQVFYIEPTTPKYVMKFSRKATDSKVLMQNNHLLQKIPPQSVKSLVFLNSSIKMDWDFQEHKHTPFRTICFVHSGKKIVT